MRVHIGMDMSENWHSAVSIHGIETSRMPAESSIHNMRTPCLPLHWHNVYAMRPHGHVPPLSPFLFSAPPPPSHSMVLRLFLDERYSDTRLGVDDGIDAGAHRPHDECFGRCQWT